MGAKVVNFWRLGKSSTSLAMQKARQGAALRKNRSGVDVSNLGQLRAPKSEI
jgi:hypothetical protein